ncbi:MAG: hypothetical protein REI78_04040 [Pedobacter sp.]|nr:hypothetical protein [Pedobacter sp.]MDQ8052168.1 hypothetical protein [Pedobacter sp.]
MENKQNGPKEELDPVSRKTNEEIDTDDEGNLLIGGTEAGQEKSLPSDGPVSEDLSKSKNRLNDNS